MADIKIGIIGPGSVGGVIGTILCEKGYDVEIVYKRDFGVMMNDFVSFDVLGEFGEHSALIKYVKNIEDFTSKKDIIFITTKAYAMKDCAKLVEPFLKENGIVVIGGNVLTYQDVKKYIPLNRIVSIFIEWSAKRLNPTKIEVLSAGVTTIGIYDDSATPFLKIVKSLMSNISNVEIADNMLEFTLSRIVLNASIASIGAISGLRLGRFLEYKNGKKLFLNLIKEALLVFDALGIKIPPYANQLDYYKLINPSFKGKIYRDKMIKIISKNNNYLISSMLNDLDNNRKTEVDYLTGKFCRLAKAKNIDVPYSNKAVQIIKEIENGERTIYKENIDEVLNIK